MVPDVQEPDGEPEKSSQVSGVDDPLIRHRALSDSNDNPVRYSLLDVRLALHATEPRERRIFPNPHCHWRLATRVAGARCRLFFTVSPNDDIW
jgi:hypothetical protein